MTTHVRLRKPSCRIRQNRGRARTGYHAKYGEEARFDWESFGGARRVAPDAPEVTSDAPEVGPGFGPDGSGAFEITGGADGGCRLAFRLDCRLDLRGSGQATSPERS
jgi:hypothetical protein